MSVTERFKTDYAKIFDEPYPDTVPLILAFLRERMTEHNVSYERAWKELAAMDGSTAPFRWRGGDDEAAAQLRHNRAVAGAKMEAYTLCITMLTSMKEAT